MKYGQTLKQRSIREWGHYNLDYDEVKHLIKDHTSPGKGKAISIPGQDDGADRDFEDRLFALLRDQHLRIELFVKSKTSETEKRLDHLVRQIRIFRSRINPDAAIDLPIRQLEKFARIEADIHRAGQDIRSLSRFVGAQRLGFTKLLKKYRKWTGSSSLGERFRVEVLDQSLPLSRYNLDGLLHHWAEVLHSFRTVYETVQAKKDPWRRLPRGISTSVGKAALDSQASSAVLQHMHAASTSMADVDFDTSFSTLPIGDAGTKAVYWVHPDQVVEVTVMLMQYLRQRTEPARPATAGHSGLPSRTSSFSRGSLSRHGSIPHNMSQPDTELDTGLLVLDDAEQFAHNQNSNPSIELQGSGVDRRTPAGCVRWTSTSEAVVVLKHLQNKAPDAACGYQAARLKRKHLRDLLAPDDAFAGRRPSATLDEEDYVAAQQRKPEVVGAVRSWIRKHSSVAPLAAVCSKRTRFQGLTNDLSRGQWALLDQNIYTTNLSPKEVGENDWPSYARSAGARFPYAVLQVRQEGPLAVDLIDLLDHSYLTERVRGFSLEAQAVWSCCRPSSMAPPSWLPLLHRDIRKLPGKEPKPRHHSIVQFLQSDETVLASDTATTTTSGDFGSSASGTARPSSSATSILPSSEGETPSRTPRAKRKPKKAKIQALADPQREQREQQARYWNEYDDPEDEEDNDAYVIYIDPNAPLGYPGQAAIEKVISWITSPFKPATDEERRMLLSPSSADMSPTDVEDDSSSDEMEVRGKSTSYGTLPAPVTAPHNYPHDQNTATSWWTNLNPFNQSNGKRHHTRGPATNRRRLSTRPVDPFTAELEQQFDAAEASKMRHCLTSLAAAVAILAISFVLAATGRRKQRGTVDEGVLFGIVVSLLFAFAGVGYLLSLSRKDFYGEPRGLAGHWLVRGVVATVFVGICVADGALVAWIVA